MGNFELGLDVWLGKRAPCLHQLFQVKACIWECLQQHLMLLQLKLYLLSTTSQGLIYMLQFLTSHDLYVNFFCFHMFLHFVYLDNIFRTSQFIIGLNRYEEAINRGFSVGMRFKMRFEVEDSPDRR